MAKKEIKRARKGRDKEEYNDEETGVSFMEKHNIHTDKIVSIFFLFLAVFTFSSLFGLAGSLGTGYFTFITEALGIYAYLTPLLFLFFFYTIIFKKYFVFRKLNFYLLSVLIFNIYIVFGFLNISGSLGNSISSNLQNSFGTFPISFILFITTALILLRLFEINLWEMINNRAEKINKVVPVESVQEPEHIEEEERSGPVSNFFSRMFGRKNEEESVQVNHLEDFKDQNEEDEYEEVEVEEEEEQEDDVRSSMYKAAGVHLSREEREKIKVTRMVKKEPRPENIANKKDNEEKLRQMNGKYSRPPLSIYTEDSGRASAGDNKENARIIKRTLNDFGISVEMDEVTVGPTVTRYALKPAQGVKIEKIMNLANNIALELGVPSVSIIRVHERSLIGVEVPNKQKSRLGLSNLLGHSEFLERKDKLTIGLGKDIYGEPIFADLARTPHLLVAGTTGSGKSVLVHAILNSLIYKNSPYDLKFILVDPKKVELALYNNLPHLYTPVIKDPKKAVQTLNWLVQEMDRRYAVLEEFGKQNIGAYHAFASEKYRRAESGKQSGDKLPERMPYIVLVIDELADFMMKHPKEMESSIVKLAQMSRAVGIHLILATQRPSTNIITGVIKGNIPSRVALRVASQVDSRVIIDQGGAEKLLGFGDLLFMNSDGSDIKRIQSPFVSEEEIKDAVAYLRTKYDDVVTEDLKTKDGAIVGAQNISNGTGGDAGRYSADTDFASEDDKYEDAKQVVMQSGKTSVSNLQVRLGTGYARSAKLINMLEQAGVIITTTDNNGKKVKVVAGSQAAESQKLEAEADKMLEDGVVDTEDGQETEANEEKKETGSFFRF